MLKIINNYARKSYQLIKISIYMKYLLYSSYPRKYKLIHFITVVLMIPNMYSIYTSKKSWVHQEIASIYPKFLTF